MFRIHDNLVSIRIRICGSMPLTNGSGSCYFRHANKKTNLKKKFFCLLLLEDTFISFFKDKKSKRSHKTVRIKVFLLFLLDDSRTIDGSGSTPVSNGSGWLKNMWIRYIRIRILIWNTARGAHFLMVVVR